MLFLPGLAYVKIDNPILSVAPTHSREANTRYADGVSGGRIAAYRSFDKREMQGIKEKSLADGIFMKAPNGEDTKLAEWQWKMVRTQAFKEWFGDWENDPENASKVVDENGEPLAKHLDEKVQPIEINFGELSESAMKAEWAEMGKKDEFKITAYSREKNYARAYKACRSIS